MALIGADGPAVVVSGRVARLLVPVILPALRKRRDEGYRLDVELVGVASDLEKAAKAFEAARAACSAIGTDGVPPTPGPVTMGTMSTADVAERLGCGERNVRALAERQSLPGRRVGRVWTFDAMDVEEYLAEREDR